MKKKAIQIAISAIIVMSFFIGISGQPAEAFTPTNISITPNPVLIPCGGTATVTVTVTGTISFADQQAQKFEIRLVDEDLIWDDDLGAATVTPATDGQGPFQRGAIRTFTLTFELRCDTQTVKGIESSGETEADLAIEIDSGRITRNKNHYDSATGKCVPARCVEGSDIGLHITQPQEGYLYLFDKPIVPLSKTIIFGSVTTKVETLLEVESVEFYVDRELVHTVYEPPYEWLWDQGDFFVHTLGVCAYTYDENNACDEIEVLIFNF